MRYTLWPATAPSTPDERLRVLRCWPIDRNLEFAPTYWRATRARLDPEQLAAPVGVIDVPPLAG